MKRLLYPVLLFVGMLIASCTNDYDLSKDINLGVTFSPEGFRLAGTNSADIPLSQVVELSDSGELQVDSLTGDYLFYKRKDNMDTTIICIGQGSLCPGTDDSFDFSLREGKSATFTPSTRFPEFGSLYFESELSPSFDPDKLNTAIRELEYLATSMDIVITADFSGIAGTAYLDELDYEVPSFYVLADSSELVEKSIKVSEEHTHTIHVVGLDFKHQPLKAGEVIGIEPKTNKLQIQGQIKISGKTKMVNKADYDAVKEQIVHYHVMVGTLGVSQVRGRFYQYQNVDIQPITFNSLPDFIRDEEVVVDVDNPIVRLTLENELPAPVSLNAILRGVKDKQRISEVKIGRAYGTQPITFDGSVDGSMKRTTLWVSRNATEIPDTVKENVVIPEVMNLVSKMPDRVEVVAEARTDSAEAITLSLSHEYKALPKYEMSIPLKMGRNMRIVYAKNIDNLNKVLKQLDVTSVVVKATATNRIPLSLYITAQAYDLNGKEMGDDVRFVLPTASDSIPGNDTKDIEIRMESVSKSVNALQNIDKIQLRIYAESNEGLEGRTLNKNQNLRLDDIQVTLKSEKE